MVYQLPSDSLQSSAITTAKINDGAITSSKINAGAVTLEKCEATLTNALVPIGGIIIWSGNLTNAEALTAWAVCDGRTKNNLVTPDLRDRFVVGAQTSSGAYAVNATGGSADAIVVEHTHTITDPGHSHSEVYNVASTGQDQAGSGSGDNDNTAVQQTSTETTGITIDSSGSSGTNANLPPYYALLYIMRVS